MRRYVKYLLVQNNSSLCRDGEENDVRHHRNSRIVKYFSLTDCEKE